MTVCYFGIYRKNYPRTRVLINGLKQNNIQVIECNSRKKGFFKYLDLWLQHYKIKDKYNVMLIGFLGQGIIKFAKKLTSKPIILDAFVSQYLSNVEDRRLYVWWGLRAKKDKQLDIKACELADIILLDTQAQIDYFVQNFNLPRHKFKRIFASADNQIYFPQKNIQATHKFVVHWHGYIVPFYSIKTVVEAAAILKEENIEFKIVTRFDQQYEKIKKSAKDKGLKNIKFYCEKTYHGLAKLINQADVCLGIFSDNQKAKIVIPNKIYEAIACAKPVITARHKVIKELFIDNQNIFLTQPANAKSLANKILELKNNPQLSQQVAQQGHELYNKQLTPKKIVKDLVVTIKELQKDK